MPTTKTAKKRSAAKKTVAKKTPKKRSVKKTTRKRLAAKKPLVYAANSTSFWVTDGQILNSLTALCEAFDRMSKDTYVYHAGGTENDFANWVEVVLCDATCAAALRKAKTPKGAKSAVVKRLKFYTV